MKAFYGFGNLFLHEKQLHFIFLQNLITNNNGQSILILFISFFERGMRMGMGCCKGKLLYMVFDLVYARNNCYHLSGVVLVG